MAEKQILINFEVTQEEKDRFDAARERILTPDQRPIDQSAFMRMAAHKAADEALGNVAA